MYSFRVYVGGLPESVRRSDILDMFERYGKIRRVEIKDARPPYYAFIEYYKDRDAEDAVRKLDNEKLMGSILRVEFAKDRCGSQVRQRSRVNNIPHSNYGNRTRSLRSGREIGAPRRGPASTGYRLRVDGLSPSASWQDLKDHTRTVLGFKPVYSAIYEDGGSTVGIVEFENRTDLDDAYRKMNDTPFENKSDRDYRISVHIDDDTGPTGQEPLHDSPRNKLRKICFYVHSKFSVNST
jgi:arginine/serine-rich splicing factor 1/9